MVVPADRPPNHPRVLVVDDDPAMCSLLDKALSARGYTVATVPHGAAALDLVRHFHPAVVLLDLGMPVMDGRSFAELYSAAARPAASIIVMSGNADIAQQAAQIGAVDALRKPFGLDRLFAALANCLAAA